MHVYICVVSAQIEEFVKKCSTCMKLAPPVREPMIISKLPKHPWERIATDFFELNKQTYVPIACTLLLTLS